MTRPCRGGSVSVLSYRRPASRPTRVNRLFMFLVFREKTRYESAPNDTHVLAAQVGKSIARATGKLRDTTAASGRLGSARPDVTSPAGNPHADASIRRSALRVCTALS